MCSRTANLRERRQVRGQRRRLTGGAWTKRGITHAVRDDAANWMSYGRTYDEQRFSPLKKINAANVAQLGLAWFFDLDTAHRGRKRRRSSSTA